MFASLLGWPAGYALTVTHPVSEMRCIPCLQPPDQFEFDVVGTKRVEQTSPVAE